MVVDTEASGVIDMAQTCSRSDPQRTCKQRRSLKEKLRIESDSRAVETAEQKDHRLSNPRTKEKARRAARAAAEVVS